MKFSFLQLFYSLSYSCKVVTNKGLYISTSALAIGKQDIGLGFNRVKERLISNLSPWHKP